MKRGKKTPKGCVLSLLYGGLFKTDKGGSRKEKVWEAGGSEPPCPPITLNSFHLLFGLVSTILKVLWYNTLFTLCRQDF